MKRSLILGCGILGLWAANCSAPPSHDATNETGGAGGRAGASSDTGGVFGTGGSGGSSGRGGAFGVGGSGGSAIGTGGFAGAGGFPTKAGTYTEALVEAEDAPPPLTGGTLTVIGQGHRAAVSDPDHDQVVTVDLDTMSVVAVTPLLRGDEPNRSAEDPNGRVHVVLRSGHGVAVIDPAAGSVVARLPVCRLPRGIAYDPTYDAIHVACAGGELVSYSVQTGEVLRKLRLERDLRDVVVDGNRLLVSRFRAAELLVVESNGTVSGKLRPPTGRPVVDGGPIPTGAGGNPAIAAVAWRTVPSPDGGALMVYQSLLSGFVPTTPGGYGTGGCGSIISTSVSLLRVGSPGYTVADVPALLPIDLATTSSRQFTVDSAAWTPIRVNPTLTPYVTVNPPALQPQEIRVSAGPCGGSIPPSSSTVTPRGRVVALAYAANQLVLQTREPGTITVGDRSVDLPGRSRKHSGHELFHLGTVGGIACASCHPEGSEDGQVWNFANLGPRRTQNISGGISGTEPFHWSGDMETFSKLAHDVFQSRMTGPLMNEEYVGSLFRWIDKIPSVEPPVAEDPAAAERGKAIFESAEVGCATCHNGERLTNNASVNVQTGGAFQVPSLRGIAWRAPYMHQGCAPTLDARFDACGGGDAHGHTSQLTKEQRADLVAYLETL